MTRSELNARAFFVAATLTLVVSPRIAWAELQKGDGYTRLVEGGWDFSAFAFTLSTSEADLGLGVVAATGASGRSFQHFLISPEGVQFAPQGQEFDSLLIAPDSGYVTVITALQGYSYFVKTREQHYVKIQLQFFDGFEFPFRYVYQDDGSQILDESVATTEATWGRIKAIYDADSG